MISALKFCRLPVGSSCHACRDVPNVATGNKTPDNLAPAAAGIGRVSTSRGALGDDEHHFPLEASHSSPGGSRQHPERGDARRNFSTRVSRNLTKGNPMRRITLVFITAAVAVMAAVAPAL